MSHAAAVWIPKLGLDVKSLEAVVKKSCGQTRLHFDVFERTEPQATCIVTPLDERDDINMEFGLLDPVAVALARALKLPAYALFAYFGSGDWMQVTAFANSGKKRWTEGSDEGAVAATLRPVAEKLGLGIFADDEEDEDDGNLQVDGVTFPYWKLMTEVSKPPCTTDLVGLCLKPAFGLQYVKGWSARHAFDV